MAKRAGGAEERQGGGQTPGLFDGIEGGLDEPRPRTVSRLTEEIRACMDGLGRVVVEGELSGFKRAPSGHLYFDLKDESARISCVVWRSHASRAVRFQPDEGLKVVAHGRIDVYPPRGSYSLVVERLEPRGLGALLAELERLKAELRALGWLDRRRPLPALPRCVGLVTSKGGAALRDFLRTRSLRWPGYPVRLCHAAVQGPGAAFEIADAIARLDASGVDVIAVVRGGGSLEDLWAFNERPVAEAIRRARVPVVTGVGHETDTTLADLVADHRAHTPTDAAQCLIPDRAALEERLRRWGNYLIEAMDGLVARRAERLARAAGRPVLRSAGWILDVRARRLRELRRALRDGLARPLAERRFRLLQARRRLEAGSPRARLEGWQSRLLHARSRLPRAAAALLEHEHRRLAVAGATLHAISPLQVLSRGYSLTRRPGELAPLREATDVAAGETIETLLGSGRLLSRVTEVHPAPREAAGPDDEALPPQPAGSAPPPADPR